MNMHSSFPGMGMNQNFGGGGGGGHFTSYSSSSTSSSFGGNGPRESVTTSTRIINGKRQTVTERTVVKADGTVERTTETSGDDDFPRCGSGLQSSATESATTYGRFIVQ